MTEYIDEFLHYLQVDRGLSIHTLQAYGRDLRQIEFFVREENDLWPPDLKVIEKFLKVQKKCKSSSSLVRSLVAIKVFLKYLYREKYILEDISTFLDSPKVRQIIPTILSYEELERMLEAPDKECDEGVRDKAILELLYGTGIRVSEICTLSIYDVSDEYITVYGKGGKERKVPITNSALQAVDAYLSKVRYKFDSENTSILFLSMKGVPIDRIRVFKMIQKYARDLGIKKRVSPHTFRHTYASHLLDAGADVRIIQELLGHSSIASTNRYTQVSTAKLRESFRAHHPRWKDCE